MYLFTPCYSVILSTIFENTTLDKVNSIKFLGLTIDEKLSWKFHSDNKSKMISRNIRIINQLKYYFRPLSLFPSLEFALCSFSYPPNLVSCLLLGQHA